ncbi:RipA family octameric membrane protein [Shimia sp. MMG029]|uniref:RipA family octameric membrane protein n=1 Tax=Shimia sp. MMG029 TaxID=3021978 RepID=UPI0022FE7C9D|nr:hypothetical protein [Shimia sp. MMG029]MDA5557996.1 hypothetical protein [Shimia sp. MMG029]
MVQLDNGPTGIENAMLMAHFYIMENNQRLLLHVETIYAKHLELFRHSDDFVQQRTTQFATTNTILVAAYGVLLGVAYEISPLAAHSKLLLSLAIILSTVGVFYSYVWYCSYKRSAAYRKIHRDTLKELDSYILELQPELKLPRRILIGPFQLRHDIMYLGKSYPIGSESETTQIGRFETKRTFFNVESIPLFSLFLWASFCGIGVWLIVR